MEKIAARVIQILFHPLLIPVIGLFILFRTNLYIAFISTQMRETILLSAFFATCLVPAFFIIGLRLYTKHFFNHPGYPSNSIIYLFTAICYYVGYFYTSMWTLAGFYKAGFLAGTIVLILLSLISIRWNISSFTAGTGAITGLIIAIMLRLGVYDPVLLPAVLMAGGLTGYSRLVLGKNTPAQVYAGYLLGFSILFAIYSTI